MHCPIVPTTTEGIDIVTDDEPEDHSNVVGVYVKSAGPTSIPNPLSVLTLDTVVVRVVCGDVCAELVLLVVEEAACKGGEAQADAIADNENSRQTSRTMILLVDLLRPSYPVPDL